MVDVSTPPPRSDFGSWKPLRRRMTPRLDVPVPERDGQLGERGDREPERERLEEVVLVEADRLGDELADRPLARAAAAAGSGSGCAAPASCAPFGPLRSAAASAR